MLEFLGTALSSIVGGGLTGILGVVAQRVADYKNKQLDLQLSQQKFNHELAMKQADAAIMREEFASRTQVANIEADSRVNVADSQAFAASFNEPQKYSEGVKPSAGQGWMLVILDFIRGIVRPGLTLYLCALTTLIYVHAREQLKASPITPEHAHELVKLIIGTILYLFTSCLLWWFGSRNKQPAPKLK